MEPTFHIHLNGLSIGGGGGYTVGLELLRHFALVRPAWRVTLGLIEGFPLHEEMRSERLPGNAGLLWTPPSAAAQWGRAVYERRVLPGRLRREGANAVIQLNGQWVPQLGLPTLCHFQDPFPYRFDLLEGLRARFAAAVKRRLHRRSLREAAVGFTSGYLRDLICGHHGIQPAEAKVFYNGVPDAWLERARRELPPLDGRPMELVTVSNVAPYKGQEKVIRALAELGRRPAYRDLVYRIVGHCDPAYRATLERLTRELGVADRVVIEGRVPAERVEQAYRQARCFILMSACESFGLPAVEAMTFGAPVVVARSSALPEVVGDAGIVCPEDDVAALCGAIEEALDPERAEALRIKGRARVEAFQWRAAAEGMAQRMEQLCGEARDMQPHPG